MKTPWSRRHGQTASEVAALTGHLALSAYRRSWRALHRVQFLRSGFYLSLAVRDLIRDSPRSHCMYQREFERGPDPWGYAGPNEQARHRLAASLLDTSRVGMRFEHALEVGCAEGAFTEFLEPRCAALLAVDYVPLALARARLRRRWGNHVRFAEWNLRRDPLPGTYDLIVVMDVLSSLLRPSTLRAATAKLVEGVRPGGYLLVGDVRQNEFFETTWWGKKLIRGGKWIISAVAQHSGLVTVSQSVLATHIFALYRKTEDECGR